MSVKFHLRKGVYWALIIAIGVIFFSLEGYMSAQKKQVMARIEEVNQENVRLTEELQALESELAFVKTDEGIELYARAMGMRKPGETRYSAVNAGK